jgi:hypothetical protein
MCSTFGSLYVRSTVRNTSEIFASVSPRVDLSTLHSARHLHFSAQTAKKHKISRVALTLGEGHSLWIDFTHAQYSLVSKTASWTDTHISQNAAPGKLVQLLWRGRIIDTLVTKLTIKIKVIEKRKTITLMSPLLPQLILENCLYLCRNYFNQCCFFNE